MIEIVVILHDIRSTYNVGSILRTCDGFGVKRVFLTGYTPYPKHNDDKRLPHIANKLERQIQKTALGAEKSVKWEHTESVSDVISQLKQDGFRVVGIEQSKKSVPLPEYIKPNKVAVVFGREVEGIEQAILTQCDDIVEIPMYGTKESFNVAQSVAIALYALRET